jgi:hypothetical protein
MVDPKLHPGHFQAAWAARPLRNQRMLTEGKPNLFVAFPGGKGTANMVAQDPNGHVLELMTVPQ